MLFKEKVAIITGSGSGIGRTTALMFVKEGARLAVVDIDLKSAEETVELINKNRGEAIPLKTDITRPDEVKKMVTRIVKTWGRIDILVNNAGIFREGSVVETSEQEWQNVLNVNLTGTFLCMKYCIPIMIEKGGGSIVNISSEAGLVGIKNQVAYNVSKSAVIALTRSTAVDFATRNIRVNCICPGRVLTPLVEKVIQSSDDPEGKRLLLSEDRPVKRMGTPEEIAAGVLFLASDQAKYATGTVMSIDGGYTCLQFTKH